MNAKKTKLLLGLILICLALLFVIQNTILVDVRFLFWTLSMSGALLFILLMVSGAVFGWIMGSVQVRKSILNKKVSEAKILAEAMARTKTSPSTKRSP